MRREALDTNVILRLIVRDIAEQYEAAKKLVSSHRVRFFISDVALFEFVYILSSYYHFSRKQIREMVTGLLSLRTIDCNRELIEIALEYFVLHNSLSFADCYLAASATFMNASPLWTFDQDLAKRLSEVKLIA